MEEELERIEIALRHDQKQVALELLARVRERAGALVALEATADGALTELGDDTKQEALLRFVARIRAGFDPDLDR